MDQNQRVKDFYKDAVGELEYTYVTREVYEALVDTFRKEAHTGNAGYQTYDQGRIYRRRNGRSGGADWESVEIRSSGRWK